MSRMRLLASIFVIGGLMATSVALFIVLDPPPPPPTSGIAEIPTATSEPAPTFTAEPSPTATNEPNEPSATVTPTTEADNGGKSKEVLPTTTEVPPSATEVPTVTPETSTEPPTPIVLCPESPRGYVIQEGDSLSRVSEQLYGTWLDFEPIYHYTNQLCRIEPTYSCIDDPGRVKVGTCIYLPTEQEVNDYWEPKIDLVCSIANGPISIDGSSTVYPLTERIKGRIEAEGFTGALELLSSGSGTGLKRFCEGEIDIANASRPIKEKEIKLCQENDREPLAFQVGTDALVIAVNSANDFIGEATLEELKLIFSDQAFYWSDVKSDWPREPISRFVPGLQSGTLDYFVEEIFNGNRIPLLEAANLELNEDDNELVQGIQNNPHAIGFFGYAYYHRNQDTLKALKIEGIEPSPESADNKTYPLLRPLYMYTTADLMQQKPQINAFVGCYLAYVKDELYDVGYFLPDDEAFKRTIDTYKGLQ